MHTIRPINPCPDTHLDPDFQTLNRLVRSYNHELIGGPEWDTDPADDLASIKADPTIRRFRWFAELDGTVAGYGNMIINTRDEPDAGNVLIYVLPEFRSRGIGAKLAKTITAQAQAEGIKRLTAWIQTPVPTGPVISPSYGVGEVPADHAGIKLALRDGFKLGQVERISRYDFANPSVEPREALAAAQAKAGPDYEVLTWEGITDESLLADYALVKERMTRDVPHGDMTETPVDWDAARILELDQRITIANRFYRSAIRHKPSGTLVALCEMARMRSNDQAFVDQWDTVVLAAHRGKRLGMLVKAANLIQVREAEPSATSIVTWNAVENHHMLAVNEALGFYEIGREAAMEKKL